MRPAPKCRASHRHRKWGWSLHVNRSCILLGELLNLTSDWTRRTPDVSVRCFSRAAFANVAQISSKGMRKSSHACNYETRRKTAGFHQRNVHFLQGFVLLMKQLFTGIRPSQNYCVLNNFGSQTITSKNKVDQPNITTQNHQNQIMNE